MKLKSFLLWIPEPIHKRLKALAAMQVTSMQELINYLIERELNGGKK